MKAVYLVGAKTLEMREVPDPFVPEDGLVLRVKACGICGSDLRRWNEGPSKGIDGLILGHEITGIVEEIGEEVKEYSVGDRLAVAPDIRCGVCYYCQRGMFNLCDNIRFIGITPGYPGGFAENIVLTNEILNCGIVNRMPKEMSFVEGTISEPYCSALAVHEKAGTSLKDTVVILGAGPMGCILTAIAQARGAIVILSDPNETRRDFAKCFHPKAIIDPSREDVVSRVRELTHGLGADIVICANPVAETQVQAVEMVRKAGRVVLFGGLPKSNSSVSLNTNAIHYGEIVVEGSFSYHPTLHKLALEVLRRRLISSELFITHIFPLEKINEAFAIGSSGMGLKIVITP